VGAYYEDFEVGKTHVTPGRTVTDYEVAAFAGLSGDFNSIHTDREFAATTSFGEPIAHGVLGLAIATGLIARTGLFDGTAVAFLGIDGWKFSGPILFGDTIHVEFVITSKRETKNPATGLIVRAIKIINQRGEVIQSGDTTLLVRRRGDSA